MGKFLFAKRAAICALGVVCCVSSQARKLYLAPGGTGNGRSIENPMGDPVSAIGKLEAGDTLYVRGGTYALSQTIKVNKSGTKDHRICVFAYENEKPVFDFSGQNHTDEATAKASRGILHNIGANYWHYRGLEIANAADNGMKLEGSFCVVELCTFHGCGDTGLQQGFGKGSNGENTRNQNFLYGRYNIIVNCDSYDNYDTWSSGGDADGFAIKLFPGPGNEFHGCRAWNNSDDAWDLYYTNFPVLVDNCWALKSGVNKGNGNGFKMGGCKQGGTSVGAHVFMNCVAAFNLKKGFDQNHHLEGSYLINNTAFENGINYGYNMEELTYGNWVLRNCIGFAPTDRNHTFTKIPDSKNCNWLDIDGLSPISDRESTDKVTSNKYNKYAKPSAWPDYSSEFENLDYNTAIGPRGKDGGLPAGFARLKAGSRFIDKGAVIKDFVTTDAHKKEYEYSANAPQDYSMALTIPFTGAAPDYGAYEFGGTDNAYDLVFPENDGTVEDATVEQGDGKYYDEKTLVNNYLFQDEVIAPEVRQYISAESQLEGQGVIPLYNGKISGGGYYEYPAGPGDKYGTGTSYGAYKLPKTGWIEFSVPELAAMQSNIYCTGSRTLEVTWGYTGSTETKTVTKSMSTGTASVDIASMIGAMEKKPVTVRICNVLTKGDMYLTDLTLKSYIEVDEDGNPITTGIGTVSPVVKGFDMYQTDNALIVYGNIASLRLYSVEGRMAAESRMSQYISTAGLSRGVYVVVAVAKDGSRMVRKIMLR
ncbi:MAG: right-handed parallel beta-helix repeat-containing protein [Prevotella sp.]|nr:right-handed parallel beta-helix repeat-containing protein [Prevotella sp.]